MDRKRGICGCFYNILQLLLLWFTYTYTLIWNKHSLIHSLIPSLTHLLFKEKHLGYEHLMLRCMTYENEHWCFDIPYGIRSWVTFLYEQKLLYTRNYVQCLSVVWLLLYYNICCFRAVNNAPSQIQRNLFMLGNSPYKLDECSGYWSLLYVKVTIWVFKLIKVNSEPNTSSGVINTRVQSPAFDLGKDWFYYSILNSKITSLS